jgi:uncharacterized protein YggE
MKKTLFLLLISISVASYSQVGQKNFIDQNYIEVTGKSEMEITPDQIYIKVLLNEKDSKNKVSVEELERNMISKLNEIGIDTEKDLLIKDISSNFKYYLLLKDKILLSKEYQILVDNGKIASQVFIELENIGISNVSIDRVDNSNIEKFRNEAKIEAIIAAKEKAESLVEAIGQEIGKAIFIQELSNPNPRTGSAANVIIRGTSSIYGSSSSNIPDIEFEKIIVEYSVLCRFELN